MYQPSVSKHVTFGGWWLHAIKDDYPVSGKIPPATAVKLKHARLGPRTTLEHRRRIIIWKQCKLCIFQKHTVFLLQTKTAATYTGCIWALSLSLSLSLILSCCITEIYMCSISRISPSWVTAGCKKTLCLLHHPHKIKWILSLSLSLSLSLTHTHTHTHTHTNTHTCMYAHIHMHTHSHTHTHTHTHTHCFSLALVQLKRNKQSHIHHCYIIL